jgi:uncharacterized protein
VNDAEPWRETAGGIVVRCRLTPKAAHDRIDGVEQRGDGAVLKVRVRAVPEDGKANTALQYLLADWLRVARSSVSLTAGGKSRTKSVTISGDTSELSASVATRLANLPLTSLPTE